VALALVLFVVTASHSVLHALTNGGMGVAFFALPTAISCRGPRFRYRLSVWGFFANTRGLAVFASEFLNCSLSGCRLLWFVWAAGPSGEARFNCIGEFSVPLQAVVVHLCSDGLETRGWLQSCTPWSWHHRRNFRAALAIHLCCSVRLGIQAKLTWHAPRFLGSRPSNDFVAT